MAKGRIRLRVVLLLSLATLVLLASFILSPTVLIQANRRTLVNGAKVGWTRAEVEKHLGAPTHIAKSISQFTGTGAYQPIPTEPVGYEVLEYYRFPWKLYVYVDDRDRVTHVFLART